MSRVAQQARRFPEFDLRPLHLEGLDRRDATLARAIDLEAGRRWLTLVAVLRGLVHRPWSELAAPVQGALLAGACQLLMFERLPDHGVINAAVSWVKAQPRGGRGAGGLVNAVLRRVAGLRGERGPGPEDRILARSDLPLHDGRVLRLNTDAFAQDPQQCLAEQTSHPPALLERWRSRFGSARTVTLAHHDLMHAPVILAGGVGKTVPGSTPHEIAGFAVLDDPAELERLLAADPSLRVQDPGSAAAVESTKRLAPRLIADVCAGRGTKTRQLVQTHPGAHVVATDRNPRRRETLRSALAGEAAVEVVEPGELVRWAGRVDLVVVDAPCSNTAALGRRVEARYRADAEHFETLAGLQRQILADAIRLLAESGHLLYSTCSLEAEENEQQVEWATRWHPLQVLEQGTHPPAGLPGDPPTRYRDGSFAALLQRRD
jgi:16S rRNA (cytosine967-C5)-methyltransferase